MAGPHGVLELAGATAVVWRLLEAPANRTELAAAFAATGAPHSFEELNPVEPLLQHDLLRAVP